MIKFKDGFYADVRVETLFTTSTVRAFFILTIANAFLREYN